MKKVLFYCLILPSFSFGQTKIVLNGAVVNLENNAFLVVENAASDAIVRYSGYIDSEGANNNIKWMTGSTIGSFTVPFGSGGNYIPVSFSKTQNTGAGFFVFSTYPTTNWQNSASMPPSVTDVNDANGFDNSAKMIDRFWKIQANYAMKPNLYDLQFTYLDPEHSVASNNIMESHLMAERWNSSLNTWNDMPPTGDIDVLNNTLTISSLNASNLFDWWTLVSYGVNLPIQLSSFGGTCDEGQIQLNWTTASEQNNEQFEVEVSGDGSQWISIAALHGAGTTSHTTVYGFQDVNPRFEVNYYRLKQTDLNGVFSYSDPIFVSCASEKTEALIVCPNPNQGSFQFQAPVSGIYRVCNEMGQFVSLFEQKESESQLIRLENLSSGVYFVFGPENKHVSPVKMIVNQ